MVALFLGVLGGVVTIVGGWGALRGWPAGRAAKWIITVGVVTISGSFLIWNHENKKENWRLTVAQREGLSKALRDRGSAKRFPVVFYPVNGNFLSLSYAYEIYNIFVKQQWPVAMVTPNWVVPTGVTGLDVARCDIGKDIESETEKSLKTLLRNAGIRFTRKHTEQSLNSVILRNGVIFKCPAGIIVGRPPRPSEREADFFLVRLGRVLMDMTR